MCPVVGPDAPRQTVLALCVCVLAVLALAANRPPDAPQLDAPRRGRAAPTDSAIDRPSPPPASGSHALLTGRPIDLNRASASDLELLPGIGPQLAGRIVADRSARGAFKRVDELVRVHGVGQGKLQAVQALLVVAPAAQ